MQPYKQTSLKGQKFHKLNKLHELQIIEKLGHVAYKLDLPSTSRIHRVFHVSLLKKLNDDPHAQHHQLPTDSTDNRPIIRPIAILDSKLHKDDPTAQKLVLVQWKGLPIEETIWEDFMELTNSYPNLQLEDKVILSPEE